ncbi:MAG: ATP-binding cassette domain-containing protein [Cyanobacteria bacterium K_DeepCast_35m_m2_023]|nr:ATP-binding cassette domain-containing protein [Cyanobacteria bacterium K_DeepCast_35m_m2_023]
MIMVFILESIGCTMVPKPLLQATALRYQRHGRNLLRDLALSLWPGTCLVLRGDNGAGKSTLLELLHGRRQPDAGEIRLHGRLHRKPHPSVALLPQHNGIRWDTPIDVQTLVQLSSRLASADQRYRIEQTSHDFLAVLQLETLARRSIAALSGGEQQRVLLARALAQRAEVLLLDEPFSALDQTARSDLAQAMISLIKEQKSLLIAHHGALPAELQQLATNDGARALLREVTLQQGQLW